MKKSIFGLLAVVAFCLASCSSQPSFTPVEEEIATIDNQTYKTVTAQTADNKIVMTLVSSEKTLIPAETGYLKITYLGENYFLGMKVGELYVYDNQGKKLFENAYQSASVNHGKFILGQDSIYYLGLQSDGNKYKAEGPYESIYIGENNIFIRKNGKWNLREKLGTIPDTFSQMFIIKETSSGKTYYAVEEKNKSWTIYNEDGKRYNRFTKAKMNKMEKAAQNAWNAHSEGLSGFSIESLKKFR